MTIGVKQLLLGHLVGESWHLGDLLLYGGASVGLVLGIGLFLWGRSERVGNQLPPPAETLTET
jgi:hypothetical protein